MDIYNALDEANNILEMENLRSFLTGDQVMALTLIVRSMEKELRDRETKIITVGHEFELHELDDPGKVFNTMYELFVQRLIKEKALHCVMTEPSSVRNAKIIYSAKVVVDKKGDQNATRD